MKQMKTVAVPATTRESVDFVTCDICGALVEEKQYDVNEIEVRHKSGYSCPGGASLEETSVDLCGKCFDEKLVPWLRSQGAEPRTEKWEW